jgi:hypothetical protein
MRRDGRRVPDLEQGRACDPADPGATPSFLVDRNGERPDRLVVSRGKERMSVIAKSWNDATGQFEVTFDLPGDLDIDSAVVVGDFNDWDDVATPMERQRDGRLAAVVSLEPGRVYRFRYHLSGDRWENDWNADDYVPNDFGVADSMVKVPDAPNQPPVAKKAAKKAGTKRTVAANKNVSTKKATAKRAGTKKAAAANKKARAKKTVVGKVAKKSAARRMRGTS